MNDTPDLLGHVWLDGKCKKCEMRLREAPADVKCFPRDWVVHIEQDMDTGKRARVRVKQRA